MTIELEGKGSSATVVSRSVAKDSSSQIFRPNVIARAEGKVTLNVIL